MNRVKLWGVAGAMAMTLCFTGCLRHQVRSASCGNGSCGQYADSSCQAQTCGGQCGEASCRQGNCGGRPGVLNRLRGDGCRNGCVAGPLGWQQGGLNYSSHLGPGMLGHGAGAQLNQTPFTPGPPTAQVGYPYYSVRGPRDFLIDNPPTIGP